MTSRVALSLARPLRGALWLVAGAVAVACALVIAAVHLAVDPERTDVGLARYVTEGGLRGGVILATLLLTVPVLALVLQGLRAGSLARERRMAALRLAGATPRDTRLIAGVEAGRAGLAGGLLAGPAYLVLWVLAGVLPPWGARLVDVPVPVDLVTWGVLVPIAALATGAVHARSVDAPLDVRRRARPAPLGRGNLAALIAGAVLMFGTMASAAATDAFGALLVVWLLGLLLVAFAGGPRLVLGCAHLLARRPGGEALLAARRLRADPHSAGRVAAVLIICGVALGIDALLVAQFVRDGANSEDAAFYFGGFGLAAALALVSAIVAMLTLLVGAADALLDARRPLAALSAHGVDERALTRVLARQLRVTAIPAVAAGALLGAPMMILVFAFGDIEALPVAALALLPGAVAALFGAGALAAAASIAAKLLRPTIRAALDPENLRAA